MYAKPSALQCRGDGFNRGINEAGHAQKRNNHRQSNYAISAIAAFELGYQQDSNYKPCKKQKRLMQA